MEFTVIVKINHRYQNHIIGDLQATGKEQQNFKESPVILDHTDM